MLRTRPAERMSDAELTRLTDKWMRLRLQDRGVSLAMFLEHPDFYLKAKAAMKKTHHRGTKAQSPRLTWRALMFWRPVC